MSIQSFSQIQPTFDYRATINTEILKVESAAQQVHTDVEASNKSYGPGQTMSFQFPTGMNMLLDCERTTLYFKYLISDAGSGDKGLSLADDASSFFDSVEVFINNVSIRPLYNYNLLKAIHNSVTVTDEARSGPLSVYAGFGQIQPTGTSYSTKAVSAQLTLDSIFGKTSRLLPMFLLSNVEIRIRLAQAHTCLVKTKSNTGTAPAGATYTISDPVVRCFGKQLNDVDRNTLTQQFLKDGLTINTTAFEHYPVSWSGAVNSSVSIDTRKMSVKGAVVVFRKSSLLDVNKFAYTSSTAGTGGSLIGSNDVDVTSGNKLLSYVGDINSLYWNIGSDRFPQNFDVDTKEAQAFELHNYAHGQVMGYRVKPTLWTTGDYTSVVYAKDFETSHTGALISGISNANKQKSDIKMRIVGVNGSPSGLTGDAFVHFDRHIHISPRGSVRIVE